MTNRPEPYLDADGRPLQTRAQLAAELRRLLQLQERQESRKIKRSALAKRVRVSESSLYAYLNGTTLPSSEALDLLLEAIGIVGPARGQLLTIRDNLELGQQAATNDAAPRPPRELPPDVYGFVGRANHLAAIDSLMAEAGENERTIVISAISGMAGVGKTALAVHWAQSHLDRFPDGHLYIDLRGFSDQKPLSAMEALEQILRSLGAAGNIAPDVDGRARQYRSLVHDRKMLLVLDNAHRSEQVRFLLPGTPSCYVIVTSRNRLAGLVARHGARRLDVDVMTEPESLELLRLLVGSRIDQEPDAALEIVRICERLPLALRVAAEVAIERPDESLGDLAAELLDEKQRLTRLDADGDSATGIRSVFSWSYAHLSEDARRIFQLISLTPGPDIDSHATAAMCGVSYLSARNLLRELSQANLAQENRAGRFRLHDLLRTYGRELSSAADSMRVREDALSRLLQYYLVGSTEATRVLYPALRPRLPVLDSADVQLPELGSTQDASDWHARERKNIVALSDEAIRCGYSTSDVTALSVVLAVHYDVKAYYSDSLILHANARTAARLQGDRRLEAIASNNLGVACLRVGRLEDALQCYDDSLRIAREIDDSAAQARALNNVGMVLQHLGRYKDALATTADAVKLARATGDPAGVARTLGSYSTIHIRMGRYGAALNLLEEALAKSREANDAQCEVIALGDLGVVYATLGRYGEAQVVLEQSLALARSLGDRHGEASALSNLGLVQLKLQATEAAAEALEEALSIQAGIDDRAGSATTRGRLAKICRERGRFDEAIDLHASAMSACESLGNLALTSECSNDLAETLLSSGDLVGAGAQYAEALGLARQIGSQFEEARALEGIGSLLIAEGKTEDGFSMWRNALELYDAMGVPEAAALRRRMVAVP